jgi:hypothetical protein
MLSQRHAQEVDAIRVQLRNLAGNESSKAVITANERSIQKPIVKRAQRLSIGENNATERGTKARILIGGHFRGKESLTRGRLMAEAWSRGGARARTIESKQSWSTT